MPSNTDMMDGMDDLNTLSGEALIEALVERTKLEVLDEMLKDEGVAAEVVRESTSGDLTLREQTMKRAKVELEGLAKRGAREPLRRLAARLVIDPAARIRPVAAKKAPQEDDDVNEDEVMKHVELRIDWTKCIRDTMEWPGKDEMYMIGKIFPADRPKAARGIDFHLGDFKKGQRFEYGGTELVQKVSIAGSKKFPTSVICLLTVLERDDVKNYGDFVDWLLDKIEEQLAAMSEDKKPPKWWQTVREVAERVIDWIGGLFARPEILKHKGSRVITFESPKIKTLTDTWPSDQESNPQIFRVTGHGGKYDVCLLFRRSK